MEKMNIFKKGKKDGFACEWYQNGKPKLETTFKDGLKNGTHIEWNESGEKVIEGNFKKGVLISKTPLGRSS